MSNTVIRTELETRLKQWADAQVPKIPISFEGVPFTKPTSGVFLEAVLIPNVTLDTDVSASGKRRLGLFQVNCWAKSGKGMREVETLAQSVIDLFPILPKTGTVSIESTPFADQPLDDPAGWIIVPVLIQYRYESP